jgi:hypothetical protein
MSVGIPDALYDPPYPLTQFQSGINSRKRPVMGSTMVLTTAQLLALQTTAIVIEPSPSTLAVVGKVALWLVLERMSLEYIFNSTAFTIGNANNAFQIEYVGKTTALATANATGLVDQAASTCQSVAALNAGPIANANCVNLGFEMKLVGTTPALTLGNGTLKVVLNWTMVSIDLGSQGVIG